MYSQRHNCLPTLCSRHKRRHLQGMRPISFAAFLVLSSVVPTRCAFSSDRSISRQQGSAALRHLSPSSRSLPHAQFKLHPRCIMSSPAGRAKTAVGSAAAASTTAAASSEATKAMKLRVVSYNVLSSGLSGADHFTTYNPDHLLPSNRLPVVLQKLDDEVDRDAIICLQEVSHEWAGALHTYFANKGYHMTTGLYGKSFSGYMGVALAWPTATMETLDVDICRLSDKRQTGWPQEPEDDTDAIGKLWEKAKKEVRQSLVNFGLADRPPAEPWDMSQWRSNMIVTATLKHRASQNVFSLGTYHMPCAFYAPQVMTIHSEMAVKHVQTLADGNPCILAGDFNIKPVDPMYTLLTTGAMEKDAATDVGPAYPVPKWGMEWEPTIQPMISAYAQALGKEPAFTNHARVHENEPFIDTLDYIFCSDQWKVDGVLELPAEQDESKGPFPNLEHNEASDHVLIAADLSLGS